MSKNTKKPKPQHPNGAQRITETPCAPATVPSADFESILRQLHEAQDRIRELSVPNELTEVERLRECVRRDKASLEDAEDLVTSCQVRYTQSLANLDEGIRTLRARHKLLTAAL